MYLLSRLGVEVRLNAKIADSSEEKLVFYCICWFFAVFTAILSLAIFTAFPGPPGLI